MTGCNRQVIHVTDGIAACGDRVAAVKRSPCQYSISVSFPTS